jgi:hypothetical protein
MAQLVESNTERYGALQQVSPEQLVNLSASTLEVPTLQSQDFVSEEKKIMYDEIKKILRYFEEKRKILTSKKKPEFGFKPNEDDWKKGLERFRFGTDEILGGDDLSGALQSLLGVTGKPWEKFQQEIHTLLVQVGMNPLIGTLELLPNLLVKDNVLQKEFRVVDSTINLTFWKTYGTTEAFHEIMSRFNGQKFPTIIRKMKSMKEGLGEFPFIDAYNINTITQTLEININCILSGKPIQYYGFNLASTEVCEGRVSCGCADIPCSGKESAQKYLNLYTQAIKKIEKKYKSFWVKTVLSFMHFAIHSCEEQGDETNNFLEYILKSSFVRQFMCIRIGHAVNISDNNLSYILQKAGDLPKCYIELCPISNMTVDSTCNTLSDLKKKHLRLLKSGIPVVICTDDPGLFESDLKKDWLYVANLLKESGEKKNPIAELLLCYANNSLDLFRYPSPNNVKQCQAFNQQLYSEFYDKMIRNEISEDSEDSEAFKFICSEFIPKLYKTDPHIHMGCKFPKKILLPYIEEIIYMCQEVLNNGM